MQTEFEKGFNAGVRACIQRLHMHLANTRSAIPGSIGKTKELLENDAQSQETTLLLLEMSPLTHKESREF